MKTPRILDYNELGEWENHIFSSKDILWSGSPKIELSFRFLDQKYYHDVMTGASSTLAIYIVLLVLSTYGLFNSGHYLTGGFLFMLGLSLPFLLEYWTYRNRTKTRYVITSDAILFRHFNGFRYIVHSIPFHSISNFYLADTIDDLGSILIYASPKPKFSSYNGKTGLKRMTASFESIPHPKEVLELLARQQKRYPPKVLHYQEPRIGGPLLKITRVILALFICSMSVYLIDFFALPTRLVPDKGFYEGKVVQHSKTGEAYVGGHYQTQKGYWFSTEHYYPELGYGAMELKASPILDIVKGIKTERMDYTDRLTSSINNGIVAVIFGITFLVMAGGLFKLHDKQEVNYELWMQVTVASAFFIVLLLYAWSLVN